MRTFVGLVVFGVAALAVAVLAQGTSSSEGSDVRRYELRQITEYGSRAGAATFVVDTKTGQLWKLVTERCPDNSEREGWEKMPGLGKNEYPTNTFSCATPPARQ